VRAFGMPETRMSGPRTRKILCARAGHPRAPAARAGRL